MSGQPHHAEESLSPPEHSSMADYLEEGALRARSLNNRGPLRFDGQGRLAPDIIEAYERIGFYVFANVIDEGELAELDSDLAGLLDRAPAGEGLDVDAHGRPVESSGRQPIFLWARPLSDPWGGTTLLNGRHPVRMEEHQAEADPPEKAIFLMLGLFNAMDSALRLSAHPAMLRVAESINGSNFVPYNDSIFLKEPGLGAAIAWHQDGTTHWESERWDPGIHGFNFMAQPLTRCGAHAVRTGRHRDLQPAMSARLLRQQLARSPGDVRLGFLSSRCRARRRSRHARAQR